MRSTPKLKGDKYEKFALKYLLKKNLKLITRNFICKGGEIDLIMEDASTIVFIEVRYRRRFDYGGAAESITKAKQRRVIHAAKTFLSQQELWERPVRFDAILIDAEQTYWLPKPKLSWIKAAFIE